MIPKMSGIYKADRDLIADLDRLMVMHRHKLLQTPAASSTVYKGVTSGLPARFAYGSSTLPQKSGYVRCPLT